MFEIEMKNLSKIYDKKIKALDNINFETNMSGILSIIGKNGAGKTTLVKILSTQLYPTSGYAKINGYDVVKDEKKLREIIAAVPQEARTVPWLTPLQSVQTYLMWRGHSYRESKEIAYEYLNVVGLKGLENVKNRKLSGGQKRKVLIASVLASDAPIIFLDEPTTGLDYISRKELWNIFEKIKKEKLIILTTHYLEEAEILGDLILILDKAKLIKYGNIETLRKSIEYQYQLKIYGNLDFNFDGLLKRYPDHFEIFVKDDEINKIKEILFQKNIRFTFAPLSLNTIFEYFVEGGLNEEN
ncbi:MAG: ABC transporter ATP-binding protein [Thermoplasmata archaeon]|jgi:ABC-2 type transport system ATP-binding protein